MQNPRSITGLPYFFSDALRVSTFFAVAASWTMEAPGIGSKLAKGGAGGAGGGAAFSDGEGSAAAEAGAGGTSWIGGGDGMFGVSVMMRFLDDRNMAPNFGISKRADKTQKSDRARTLATYRDQSPVSDKAACIPSCT